MGKGSTIKIAILANAAKAKAELEGTAKSAGKIGPAFSKVGKAIGLGLLAGGAATAVFGKSLLTAGEAASTSNARIEQVLESMGQFPGRSKEVAAGLQQQAEAMARKTGIDQNQIKQAQSTLATFAAVGKSAGQVGGTFERATKLSQDLSAAGFGSVESASVLLGKALGDPIKGISALTRVGVSFTEAEKTKIKTLTESGKVTEAQGLILKAVEAQVGGVAVATSNATDRMKVAWSQFKENLGKALLPILDKVAAVFADKIVPALGVFFDALTGKSELNEFDGALKKINNAGVIIGETLRTIGTYVKIFFDALTGKSELNEFEGGLKTANNAGIIARDVLTKVAEVARNVLPTAFQAAKTAVGVLVAVLGNPVFQIVRGGGPRDRGRAQGVRSDPGRCPCRHTGVDRGPDRPQHCVDREPDRVDRPRDHRSCRGVGVRVETVRDVP